MPPLPATTVRTTSAAPDAPSAAPGSTAPTAVLHPASDRRPQGYPEDLPFVPGTPVTVTPVREGATHGPSAQWWGVADPETVFARLLRASVEGGWTRASAEGRTALQADVVSLQRGGRVRTIIATRMGGQGLVTLSDRDAG